MNWNERRLANRVSLRIPLRFRPVTNTPILEQKGESVNVSTSGVYFTTDFPLEVGAPLEMFLQMPDELTGLGPTEMRCRARVVHVEQGVFAGGKAGVGVRIEQYEMLSNAEKRVPGMIPGIRK